MTKQISVYIQTCQPKNARFSCIYDDSKAVKLLSVCLHLRSVCCHVLMSFTELREDAGVWKKKLKQTSMFCVQLERGVGG